MFLSYRSSKLWFWFVSCSLVLVLVFMVLTSVLVSGLDLSCRHFGSVASATIRNFSIEKLPLVILVAKVKGNYEILQVVLTIIIIFLLTIIKIFLLIIKIFLLLLPLPLLLLLTPGDPRERDP